MRIALILFFAALTIMPANAKHLHPEKEYQNAWCSAAGGVTEYKNDDLTRVDCLTEDFAIEFDFANKWAESIGQSLYYGIATNKNPGIVLISENGEKDEKYVKRALTVANAYNICVCVMTPSDLNGKRKVCPR